MYFTYIWEVLKRAFTPTSRVTDMLQILAASALPAASKFAGVQLPQDANNSALAYIGLIAATYVAIRLFWAPYSIWKDQSAQLGSLKYELSRPEQLERRMMAKKRAKARMALAQTMREFQLISFQGDNARSDDLNTKMVKLHSQLPDSLALTKAISLLHDLCLKADDHEYNSMEWEKVQNKAILVTLAAQSYLNGMITAEQLALQLPQDIEPETQL